MITIRPVITLTFLLLFARTGISQPPDKDRFPQLLFFIERNLNRNIIVYEAHFDKNGDLDDQTPMKIFWLLNEKNGETAPLSYAEKTLAYGIICRKENENEFYIRLVSYKNKVFHLIQASPFRARLTTTINDREVSVDRIYIEAENRNLIPVIRYIMLEGKELYSRQRLCEYFRPGKGNKL